MHRLHDIITTLESNIRRLNVILSDADQSLKNSISKEISTLDYIRDIMLKDTTRTIIVIGYYEMVDPLCKKIISMPKEDVTHSKGRKLAVSKGGNIHAVVVADPTDKVVDLFKNAYQFSKKDGNLLPQEVLLEDIHCNIYYAAYDVKNPNNKIVYLNLNVRKNFVKDIAGMVGWAQAIFQNINWEDSEQK